MSGRGRAVPREEVAQAVARLTAAQGIEAVSLRSVAAEAGTSMGNIQYQFGSVADLVLFSLEQAIHGIETALRPADAPPRPAAQDTLRHAAEHLLADEAATVLALRAYAQLRTAASRDPRALDLLTALNDRQVAAFEAAFRAAHDRRLLHALVDPRREAEVFWTLLLAVAIEVAQGIRDRRAGLETLRYHFLSLARNRRVTRPR